MNGNWEIRVEIERWVNSDPEPGIVECKFVDLHGREWRFFEKVAVVTETKLRPDSVYPQPASIACEVVSFTHDAMGREAAEIDTERPWGIESVEGETRFQVLRSQLVNSNS